CSAVAKGDTGRARLAVQSDAANTIRERKRGILMSQNPVPATGRPVLGIAMIGSGLMAKSHTMAWRNLRTVFGDVPADIRLVVLADATEDLATVGAAQLGFERSTASWEEAINSPDVDIVD